MNKVLIIASILLVATPIIYILVDSDEPEPAKAMVAAPEVKDKPSPKPKVPPVKEAVVEQLDTPEPQEVLIIETDEEVPQEEVIVMDSMMENHGITMETFIKFRSFINRAKLHICSPTDKSACLHKDVDIQQCLDMDVYPSFLECGENIARSLNPDLGRCEFDFTKSLGLYEVECVTSG